MAKVAETATRARVNHRATERPAVYHSQIDSSVGRAAGAGQAPTVAAAAR